MSFHCCDGDRINAISFKTSCIFAGLNIAMTLIVVFTLPPFFNDGNSLNKKVTDFGDGKSNDLNPLVRKIKEENCNDEVLAEFNKTDSKCYCITKAVATKEGNEIYCSCEKGHEVRNSQCKSIENRKKRDCRKRCEGKSVGNGTVHNCSDEFSWDKDKKRCNETYIDSLDPIKTDADSNTDLNNGTEINSTGVTNISSKSPPDDDSKADLNNGTRINSTGVTNISSPGNELANITQQESIEPDNGSSQTIDQPDHEKKTIELPDDFGHNDEGGESEIQAKKNSFTYVSVAVGLAILGLVLLVLSVQRRQNRNHVAVLIELPTERYSEGIFRIEDAAEAMI